MGGRATHYLTRNDEGGHCVRVGGRSRSRMMEAKLGVKVGCAVEDNRDAKDV